MIVEEGVDLFFSPQPAIGLHVAEKFVGAFDLYLEIYGVAC
jgi:hypothetical protein